jgi:hypothetical protein
MKVVLATILRHARFQLEEPNGVRPRRRGVSVGPGGQLRMRLVEWRQ